jgi:threonine/homoserine/homoserine lactone efflux protein
MGVAISPIPIIAIILMLLSARAAANSLAFMVGWIVGVTAASIVLLLVTDQTDSASAEPSTASGVIKLALGVLAVLLGVRNLRQRPGADAEPELPAWLSRVESISPGKSIGLGLLLSAANPKNLLMTAGGMAAVSQFELSAGDSAVVVIVFVLIAVSTVVAPVVVYRLAGEHAQVMLEGMRRWLARNNAVVMGVLLLVIGAVLVGKGIGILA